MSLRDEFLRLLREDEEFRLAVVGLLGITDVQSSIRQLVDLVGVLVRNQSAVMDALGKLMDVAKQTLEIVQRLVEGQDRLWEENNRIWQEIKRLAEGQEELRKGQEALRADVNKLWEENNKIWQEIRRINENIEKLWQENKRINENIERLWEENNKLWQEFRAFREEQERFNKWMLNALVEIRDSLGGAYEYYTAHWIERWLEGRGGINCDVRANVTIPVDGSKEIDAICYDPLVIGEATIKVASIDEAEGGEIGKLLENARAAEKFFNRRVYALVLAVETVPEQVAEYLRRRANELGIVLVLGREYS